MFTVDDLDLPITVAEKIITGTRPCTLSSVQKSLRALSDSINGTDTANQTVEDMFTVNDIKEIADYLMVYYEANKAEDI